MCNNAEDPVFHTCLFKQQGVDPTCSSGVASQDGLDTKSHVGWMRVATVEILVHQLARRLWAVLEGSRQRPSNHCQPSTRHLPTPGSRRPTMNSSPALKRQG